MADGQPVSAKPGTAAPADAHRETTPGAGAVSLVNLAKSFGGTPVIRDFSLEIRPHEFIVFLGPSGCGKSTLLRLVAGLETLDAGEIHIDGRRVDGLKPGERGVAMVFQHYALYPHMTVRENMAFGLRNLGVPRDEADRRVAQAADMLEIADLLERKPGQISGGQRQRVAIGRAIVKEPRLFLFDEPLSNLDAALRVRTRLEIAQLHQRVDASTIFVTHDQVEAMTLADRIVVMRAGRVEQIGTPMEIYDRPATEFVASFVGTPSMNLLPARIAKAAGPYAAASLPGDALVATRLPASALPEGAGCKLGVRPESVSVCAPGEGQADARVRLVERLGDRTLLYVALADGTPLVAEDAGRSRVAMGDVVGLRIAPSAVHLFAAGRAWHAQED